MFSKLYVWLFGTPSVDGALAKFHKSLDGLHLAADFHAAEAAAHAEEIKLRQEALAFAQKEVARARSVAQRFEELLGLSASAPVVQSSAQAANDAVAATAIVASAALNNA